MESNVNLDAIYRSSENVVFREIDGETIIVPLTAGIGDMEDTLFSLNDTGKAIWSLLDGKRPLRDVVKELAANFEAPAGEIEEDVTGFLEELLKREILVEVTGD